MDIDKTPDIDKEDVYRILAAADELALEQLGHLDDELSAWTDHVATLSEQKCPKTYFPMVAVLLVARVMRPKDELCVFDIQQSTSSRGYAAASIGGPLMTFVNGQGIYLRTRTSQPLMGHPFTHKPRIIPAMSGRGKRAWYEKFYEMAEAIEEMDKAQAEQVLAYIFHQRRGLGPATVSELEVSADKATINHFIDLTHDFVDAHSESGKVGQAFAAALYDMLYGEKNVRMGKNHDPSFTVCGDVQLGRKGEYWQFSEVRQRSISTGDVTGFIQKAHDDGVRRVAYWALKNYKYEGALSEKNAQKEAERLGMELVIYTSPREALEDLLAKAPGTFDDIATELANRMTVRLAEAETNDEIAKAWQDLVAGLG